MANIWDKTINIDEILISELLKKQFNIEVMEIKHLGEGYDNIAYLINNEIVFRFPRRANAVVCIKNEISLLPYIAKHVSYQLSCPKFIGVATDAYPFPFAGYPIVKGMVLSEVAEPLIESKVFAQRLANWLKELHSIKILPEDEERQCDFWRLDTNNRMKTLRESCNKYQKYYIDAGFDMKLLLNIIDSFSNLNFANYQACYLHGDLYARHIMVDENHLPVGLIDWGDIHLGHPAVDVSVAIMIFTEEALLEFYKIYGDVDKDVAVFRAMCHSISFLPYAYQQNDYNAKKWAIAAINRSITKYKIIN